MKSIKSFMAISLIAGAAHAAEPFSINLSTGFGTFTMQTQTGEAVVVTMSKMPGKILDPAKLFASTRDALLKSVKGTLDNEQKLGPASEVLSFHSGSGAFLRSRLIASGDRLYQVLYVGHSAEQRENPAIAAMFDSFSIGAQ